MVTSSKIFYSMTCYLTSGYIPHLMHGKPLMGPTDSPKAESQFDKTPPKKIMSNTYLHIFPKLLQEHFLVLFVNVDLLPIVDEVIVLVGGQLFSLPISIGD